MTNAPAGTSTHAARPGAAVRGLREGAPGLGPVRTGGQHLQGLEDRLGVLRLVLGHHLEDEATAGQRAGVVAQVARGERLERSLPHDLEVAAARRPRRGSRPGRGRAAASRRRRRGRRARGGAAPARPAGARPTAPRTRRCDRGPRAEGSGATSGCPTRCSCGQRREEVQGAPPGGVEPLCECRSEVVHAVEDSPLRACNRVSDITWWGSSHGGASAAAGDPDGVGETCRPVTDPAGRRRSAAIESSPNG